MRKLRSRDIQVHIIHKQQDQDTQKSFLAPKPEIFLLVSVNRDGRKGQLFCQSWIQLQRQAKSLYLFFAFDPFFSFLWNVIDFQYCVTFRYTAKWFGYTCIHISEKAMAPHSSALAWKIPWMKEPGRLQSMGSRRVGHDWSDLAAVAAAANLSAGTSSDCEQWVSRLLSLPSWGSEDSQSEKEWNYRRSCISGGNSSANPRRTAIK